MGKRHYVRWNQDLGESCGDMDYGKLTIQIASGLSRDEERETFLHEILHAVCYQVQAELPEGKHRLLSSGIFETMRNNPGLADFIFGEELDDGSD